MCVQYEAKLFGLLDEYDKCFLFGADNVGSKQFMDMRAVRSPYSWLRYGWRRKAAQLSPLLQSSGWGALWPMVPGGRPGASLQAAPAEPYSGQSCVRRPCAPRVP